MRITFTTSLTRKLLQGAVGFALLCSSAMAANLKSQSDIHQSDTLGKLNAREVNVLGHQKRSQQSLTTTHITSETLSQYTAQSLSDLLQAHTPIYIKTAGAGAEATASFRGTSSTHTSVLWNGLKINNPSSGDVDFSLLPVWMIDGVDVLHGGSSLAMGAGALGGSVILKSVPSWGKKFYGSVVGSLGSWGYEQGMISLGGATDKVHVQAKYLYERARNDYDFVNTAVPPFDVERLEGAGYQKQGATLDLNFKLGGNHFLDLSGWYHSMFRNIPPVISYLGLGRIEDQTFSQWRSVATWRWYNKKVRSSLSVGFMSDLSNYFQETLVNSGSIIYYNTRNLSSNLQGRYNLEWDAGEKTLVRVFANAEYSQLDNLDLKASTSFGASKDYYGAGISLHQNLLPKLTGYVLARYENPGQFVPSLGLEYSPATTLTLRLNGSRNYHNPTLNDMYWNPGGNPDLSPEKGLSTDLNIEYTKSAGLWSCRGELTGYLSWVDDWIMWQPSTYYYWMATNLKEVFSRGVEAALSVGYQSGDFRAHLSANYAYTRATNESSYNDNDPILGKQLIYTPIHKASAQLTLGYKNLYAAFKETLMGERFTTSTNNATRHSLPAYLISDITLGYSWQGLDVFVSVDNLFNEYYQSVLWRPMPPRGYRLSLRYNF